MKQYLSLLKEVLKEGVIKSDRTNTGTISKFGVQRIYDLNQSFPLVTTKKVYFKAVLYELLWFLKGDTNIKYLVDNDIKIWNEWPYETFKKSLEYKNETMEEFISKIKHDESFAKKFGDLGPVYGKQWRNFNSQKIDQIANLITQIKNNPSSRRLIVSAWNPIEIDQMALPPCHSLFQFSVENNKLSCQLYQRSGDLFLGVPFNIASYSLLTMMIAHVTNLELGNFIHIIGDAHIYLNHIEQVKMQLKRKPKKLPQVVLNDNVKTIFTFSPSDIELINYVFHPPIKAKVAI